MKLLAPNGKPSNLTPEQYRLVRTPEFKAWFGNWINSPETASKVVDENGEPLVVWHGSFNNFNIFDINKIGKHDYGVVGFGFYFTPNKNTATNYSTSYKMEDLTPELYEMSFSERKKIIKGYVKSCFLFIKNPKYIKYPNDIGISDYKNKEQIISATNNLIKSNYDGVVFKRGNIYGEESGFIDWEYVCFNSNQIKLADGTNTTFDANNPDIRYADGGNINDFKYTIGGL
jgi:hypothetical protein